jgi:ubiquitin C-terminal hydrolase
MWKCDKCEKKVQPHRKTLLFKTSDILIILLKRYTSNLRKNDKFIQYPLKLNLKDFNKNYGTGKLNTYNLNGFCIHGGSLGGGHYYAVSKNSLDKQWYEYNDSNVSKINEEKVLKYTPYLFFYKRT